MNKRQFHKDKPFLSFINYARVATSYMQGQNYRLQSNLPVVCNLNGSWAVGTMFTLLWKRRISNRNGKADFLVSVPTLLVWNILTIQPIAGAQQVCRLLTPCKDDLNMSDEEKKPRDLANHSFLVYLSHYWQESYTGHSWGWMKLINCFQEGAALVSSFQYVPEHNAKCSHWSLKP